ncbi:MAG: hypothetical protein IKS90_03350 [Clostridia bacterium]|nr:hypothetical protein [Clostridia bacterium]
MPTGTQYQSYRQDNCCGGTYQHSQNASSGGQIGTKDLSIIQDEMHSEALLYKKCAVYAGYFSDGQLKNVASTAAEHHRSHFETLNNYLNSANGGAGI